MNLILRTPLNNFTSPLIKATLKSIFDGKLLNINLLTSERFPNDCEQFVVIIKLSWWWLFGVMAGRDGAVCGGGGYCVESHLSVLPVDILSKLKLIKG